ncbi:ABC transporter ATP-binding protein [Paenibacillus abyssi]|uniref:ABC transporter ATP-binding protein YtlC n=1 Tax=Paenibacillus abyssi TaxID=1340531 RepID=A0A917FML7_9BACL|nr:ABC transporter ATP-binding protein [Paenibacillus abyssi]GGF89608.1 putative ABC transporter ATP-binding protein YtlC [Paenibacillus abyssi]
MKPMLELKNVSHVYVNEKEASLAIDSLELAVLPGEFVSLVGPSGCGKTTILSLLAGLFPPAQGEVLYAGQPVSGPSNKLGYMLQQDYLFPWRTIRDNALIGLEIMGRKTPQACRAVDDLLDEMGLAGTADRYPHELSGGMRQRVALVRTLASDPEVLLLDEPFSALDMHIKLQLEDLVQRTLRRLNKTAILVTHDLAEAAAMSDRVILLGRRPGRIRQIFDIPLDIRRLLPTEARRDPGFQDIFDSIWEELEAEDGKEGADV